MDSELANGDHVFDSLRDALASRIARLIEGASAASPWQSLQLRGVNVENADGEGVVTIHLVVTKTARPFEYEWSGLNRLLADYDEVNGETVSAAATVILANLEERLAAGSGSL